MRNPNQHVLRLVARRPLIYTSRSSFSSGISHQTQQRLNSSSPSSKPSSPSSSQHTDFWKTFTRPLSKVLLAAFLTYQLAYLGWSKLEFMETREDIRLELEKLEAEARSLQQKGKGNGKGTKG